MSHTTITLKSKMSLFRDEASHWAEKLLTDINLLPLIPDEDNNFGDSIVLDFKNDDVTWNPRIDLSFIQNISPFLKEFRHFALCFSAHQKNKTSSPGFLGQRFNNLQRVALLTYFDIIDSIWQNFLRHQFIMTKSFPNLVNSSSLWLTNQKPRNILNNFFYYMAVSQNDLKFSKR